ncbi:MAG: FkbM family methyltransferase [Chlamydiota bacterium]
MNRSISVAIWMIQLGMSALHGDIPMNKAGNDALDGLFHQFISPYLPLRESDGKIDIPESVKHVKLDIGLSYSAPMSQHWLSQEDDLIVFGFEPNPSSVNRIRAGAVRAHPSHGEPLETKYLDTQFFLIPCALGQPERPTVTFYVTAQDCGCSSIYEPVSFEVERVIEVPFFPLSDFFDLFPFDTHPVIEYIKIDAQGSDLDIVKSAGHYIPERVIYVTIEAENVEYRSTHNSEQDIDSYMTSIGFVRHWCNEASDPTYVNSRYLDYLKVHDIKIYQKG